MSLPETAELFLLLTDMNRMLSELDVKTESLRARVGSARGELREFEYITFRCVSLLRRMGLPEDVTVAMQKLQQMILIMRMLHSTAMLLQTGTPYGIALSMITYTGALFQMYDMGRG